MASWFKVRKAAQIAAFFARKEGGAINLLKLVKLIYLANRRAMEKYDYPLIDDYLVSMDQGPVNSTVYDYMNGVRQEREDWEEFVTGRTGYTVGLRHRALSTKDLDELSDADLGILNKIWDRFGRLDEWALVKYTHRHCPEWEDPHGTSLGIPYERVFKALGKKHSAELARLIEQRRQIASSFSG
jgi:uncharacterized phage-associated protein